jgi:hypothetical protein
MAKLQATYARRERGGGKKSYISRPFSTWFVLKRNEKKVIQKEKKSPKIGNAQRLKI